MSCKEGGNLSGHKSLLDYVNLDDSIPMAVE